MASGPSASELAPNWLLDPQVTFLNHGSFGACPRSVLELQTELRKQIEREPVQFFVRDLWPLLERARAEVAGFVGAQAEDVVFVRNVTHAVNGVLRSLSFEPGDQLLTTDHGYNACRNVLDYLARRTGARVVVAPIPFPIDDPAQAIESVLEYLSPRTRLAVIDHVTSPTGLVLPISGLVRALRERGVETLVDGAHGPGMLPLDLESLGAAYYTANFHKWVCAPKGAGLLWARRDKQHDLHPAVVSHGFNSPRNRKRFLEEFDWTGTDDPTPWLCVPEAIRSIGGMLPGGWDAVRARNRATVLEGRRVLCEALGVEPPAPESMIGFLASLPLPDGEPVAPESPLYADPLQKTLFERHRIEVPIPPWPAPPKRLVRISAHLYNEPAQYVRLGEALRLELGLGS